MVLIEKFPKLHLLFPSYLKNHPKFNISLDLKEQVIISYYKSISEIKEICKNNKIDIIILEDTTYSKWYANNTNLTIGVIILDSGKSELFPEKDTEILGWIPFNNFFNQNLNSTLVKYIANIKLRRENELLKSRVFRQESSFSELHDIGIALSEEKNINNLLEKIISKSMQLTYADGGSLYLVESIPNSPEIRGEYWANKQVIIKVIKNYSRKMNQDSKSIVDLTLDSIYGNVILNGKPIFIDNVYKLSEENDFHWHGREIDEKYNYRTKSMLTVPIFNKKKLAIGAIQLVNCKKHFDTILGDYKSIINEVIPFEEHDLKFVESIASQAAVAIGNVKLLDSVHILFDGFINASLKAIESRDPTTSGHSSRVATLTIAMAETLTQIKTGRFSSVSFTADQLNEIRYASLLHDFGKIGVRERVLVKSKKLYPDEIRALIDRFKLIQTLLELDTSKKQISFLLENSREKALINFENNNVLLSEKLLELDEILKFIVKANEPIRLTKEEFKKLNFIAKQTYHYPKGVPNNFLSENEVCSLSVQRGSLNEKDRKEIESHVKHTFNFLKIIPWSENLKRVPEIAHAHHEKLSGEGYPNKLTEEKIPLESKMMTISDIYDALTALDRPYRKAISSERALDILGFEAKDNHIDKDLLEIFINAKLYSLVEQKK